MEMTKTDLYFSILRHEVRNLKEWGKKTGTVHEKDLQTLYFGMPMTEEFWNRERESFEIRGIRVISASEAGSIFFPEPEELKEAFREDEMTQKYLQELQKNDLAHSLMPEQEEELVQALDKMITAIEKKDATYQPERIAAYVEEKFSYRAIAEQLEKVYQNII